MISLFFASFAVVPLSAAFVLDNHPLRLLPPAPAGNDTTTIAANSNSSNSNNNNNNTNTNNAALSLSLLPLPLPPNTSTPPPPPPLAPNVLVSYVCNADAFGRDLDVDSCTDAVRSIGVGTAQLTFALRAAAAAADGNAASDVPLPQRFISPDGRCVIEPCLAPDAEAARASYEEVAVASFVLVRNCAGKEGGSGGVARDIGGDNNLRVTLSKYDPGHLRCYSKMREPDARASCQEVLDSMPAGDGDVRFGPRSDGSVGVVLPYLLVSSECWFFFFFFSFALSFALSFSLFSSFLFTGAGWRCSPLLLLVLPTLSIALGCTISFRTGCHPVTSLLCFCIRRSGTEGVFHSFIHPSIHPSIHSSIHPNSQSAQLSSAQLASHPLTGPNPPAGFAPAEQKTASAK